MLSLYKALGHRGPQVDVTVSPCHAPKDRTPRPPITTWSRHGYNNCEDFLSGPKHLLRGKGVLNFHSMKIFKIKMCDSISLS